MATITLNGQQVDVPDGVNLIQAAASVGVTIPHYCYHPGLPIDGNCRMCLVEVEGARGPQISCNTFVKDGMVVHTETPAVEKMRKGVQEFLLLNHPIDCPICDQAGECRLQDYYMEYGQYQNRSMVPKVEKNKVVDLGPHVVLDQERCILCSRCVRFCESVTETGELVIAGRGDHSRIETFPGMQLDNPYSVNVVDLCPVGALTSKDFRFKQRVWFLSTTKSICTGCANGCAVTLDHRDGTTYRYKPRHNPNVNDYWMCDAGRLSYKRHNEGRLYGARVKGEDVPLGTAIDQVLAALKATMEAHGPDAIAIVGSAHATLEANFVVQRFATEVLKTRNVFGVTLTPDGEADDFLLKADKTPNRQGVALVGLDADPGALKRLLEAGTLKALIAVDNDLMGDGGSDWADLLAKVPTTVVLSTHATPWTETASFALPVSTHVEQFGSFIQAKGVLQKVMKAYDAQGDAVPSWELLGSMARAWGYDFGYDDIENIWTDLRSRFPEALGELSFYGIPETGYQVSVTRLVEQAPETVSTHSESGR